MLRGYATEGRRIVRAALALPAIQASALARSWALYVGAGLADTQSDHADARQMLEQCLALRRELGTPVDIAATLSTLSLVRLQTGDAAGASEGEREALRMFREIGQRRGELISLLHLGQVQAYLGDDVEAASLFEQALAIAREIKHQELQGECELLLGQIAFDLGDHDDAELRFRRSLTLCREAADRRGEASALRWLGRNALRGGDTASARTRLEAALLSFRTFEMWEEMLCCLEDLSELTGLEGHGAAAVRLTAAAEKAREHIGLPRSPRAEVHHRGWLAKLRIDATDRVFNACWSEGQAWDIEDAIRNVRAELPASTVAT